MAIWTFSSTEFLDSGFPPRAAEALRIASVAADDGQLRHAIKYYRLGIEEAIAGGMGPFDERILRIKGRLMGVIRREGDVGMEREVLEELKRLCVSEIESCPTEDRGRIVSLAVQASINLAGVRSLRRGGL